jgi:hypothetical protein
MHTSSSTRCRIFRIGQVVIVGVFTSLAVLGCADWPRPQQSHGEWSNRVRKDLDLLAKQRPPAIPPGQWEFLVGWTMNLHGNCGASETWITDRARSRRFVEALEERLQKPLDLATIDWVWDEYAAFTSPGQKYSDKYRPTRSPDLKDAQPGCFNLNLK